MILNIYKHNSGFSFTIGKFNSSYHYFLCYGIKSSYKNARTTYNAACNLMKKSYHIDIINKVAAEDLTKPFVVDMSAEQMLSQHYSELLVLMNERARSEFKSNKEREFVYIEIKQLTEELEKILELIDEKGKMEKLLHSFQSLLRKKFPDLVSKDEKEKKEQEKDTLVDVPNELQPETQPEMQPPLANKEKKLIRYAENSCMAIEHIHENIIYKINKSDIVLLSLSKNNSAEPLLKISVNKDGYINKIIPQGTVSEIYPLYSTKFYQKYWKPIVEANRHYFVDGENFLLNLDECVLPDIPKKNETFNLIANNSHQIKLSFKGEKNTAWFFEKGDNIVKEAKNSKYKEEDFIKNSPRRVQCIDPQLKSIYQKFGEVVQVIPLDTGLELDINFGRHIVRLTENQIELV